MTPSEEFPMLADLCKTVEIGDGKQDVFFILKFETLQKACVDRKRLEKALSNIRQKLGKDHTGMRLFESLVKEELEMK